MISKMEIKKTTKYTNKYNCYFTFFAIFTISKLFNVIGALVYTFIYAISCHTLYFPFCSHVSVLFEVSKTFPSWKPDIVQFGLSVTKALVVHCLSGEL